MNNKHLNLRYLSNEEFERLALPLRESVYNRELSWFIKPIRSIQDVRDLFDEKSIHLGLFLSNNSLIACVRLIITSSENELPCAPYVRGIFGQSGCSRFCEISRLMVDANFRGYGLFEAIIIGAILSAMENGVEMLLICRSHNQKTEKMLERLGFKLLNAGFYFTDGIIRPPHSSVVLGLNLADNYHTDTLDELKLLFRLSVDTAEKALSVKDQRAGKTKYQPIS